MFTNLKNKLIEEVKASPSKFQQFANAAQAAVSSSTSTTPSSSDTTSTTTNENFFSITEEDTPQNSPFRPYNRNRQSAPQTSSNGTGFIPRTRKLSNSSMASDVSFRLPTYDASNVYHLQSDLEETGSEMDDSASTSNLDVISKEKLFEAYKKSLDRYHKYRCRFTDLAKKYKDLERDSTKARAVLVETQDKALRRVNELREQCVLEQQAKAHLEEALRMEMDDMQCKLKAYQTKLNILENNEKFIDGSNSDVNENNSASKSETNLVNLDIDTIKVTELEKQLAERNNDIKAMYVKEEESKALIEKFKKQEEENTILLAQTKMAIHSELESKENEVKRLTDVMQKLQDELQTLTKTDSQLNRQNDEINELREKLKKNNIMKQEVDAKIISLEHMMEQLKEELGTKTKSLISSEERITALVEENEQKLLKIRTENERLNEIIQHHQQNEVSLAQIDNDLNSTKNEKDRIEKMLQEKEQQLYRLQVDMKKQCEINEEQKNKIEQLKEENDKFQKDLDAKVYIANERICQLEGQVKSSEINEKFEIISLEKELQKTKDNLETIKEELSNKVKEIESNTEQLTIQNKNKELQEKKLIEQNSLIETLKKDLATNAIDLKNFKEEASDREKMIVLEKDDLQVQVSNILVDIRNMEKQMREIQESHSQLECEKKILEEKIEDMQNRADNAEEDEQQWQKELDETNKQLKYTKSKLQNIESENCQLAEETCRLEQKSNRLEKLLNERDSEQIGHESVINELQNKLETTENDLVKLNEKLSKVLDENTRMQNAQELMEHDQRTLQDKYDTLEKEKLLAEDTLKCLQIELQQSKETNEIDLERIQQLQTQLKATEENIVGKSETIEELNQQLSKINRLNKDLEEKENTLESQLNNMQTGNKTEEERLKNILKDNEICINELKQNKISLELQLKEYEHVIEETKNRLSEFTELTAVVKDLQNQIMKLIEEKESLNNELIVSKEKFTDEFELKNLQLKESKNIASNLQTEIDTLRTLAQDVSLNKESERILTANLIESERQKRELEEKISMSHADVEKLHESNDALQLEMDKLKTKQQLQVDNLQKTLMQLQEECGHLKSQANAAIVDAEKLKQYDEIKIERDTLIDKLKVLENESLTLKNMETELNDESMGLKEKLKSLQCELYVLKENEDEHQKQIATKETEIDKLQNNVIALQKTIDENNIEMTRHIEHSKFITEQNDVIQRDLLLVQQQFDEVKNELQNTCVALVELKESTTREIVDKEKQISSLRTESQRNQETIDVLNKDVNDLTGELKQFKEQYDVKIEKINVRQIENVKPTTTTNDSEHLRRMNETLQHELEDLKFKSHIEIDNLQQELHDIQLSSKHMTERIQELEMATIISANKNNNDNIKTSNNINDIEKLAKDELEVKLKQIMNEVQDVSNRNIFLEQKCENYLILEQSNERLKLQNAKLSRQLDETLVSMQHNEHVTANTEFEYLKNIMFQYLTGASTGNNETLVKVISAVLKFSPQQTQVAIEKEHQRRSLLNKIL